MMDYRKYTKKIVEDSGSIRAAARKCNIAYSTFHKIHTTEDVNPEVHHVNNILLCWEKLNAKEVT